MKLRVIHLLFLALCGLLGSPLAAQQSSKSKSKDRFREKTSPSNVVRVRNVREINSPSSDYSPVFYKDGIVFVSARQKSGAQDRKTQETFFELYYSAFDVTEERWPTPPSKFSLEINSALHEGPVTFDRSYKHMFFTRNNSKRGVQKADASGKVRLKIFEAQRGPYDWSDLRELPFNSDTFSCMHPSLSADGRTLYFASDRPGGYGGADIWKVTRSVDGRSWGEPENLGPEVNSPANEVFPYIHVSGTLFFSSNGHNTLGGLDLFFYEKDENGEYVVTNLGEPFNSTADDLGLILEDDGLRGFFASNRDKGFGKDDIYAFTIEKGIEGVEKPQALPAKIQVLDARTGQPLQNAEIRILKPSDDGFVSNEANFYDISLEPIQDRPNAVSLQLTRKNATDLGNPDLYSNVAGEANTEFYRYRSYFLLVSLPGYETAERLVTPETDEVGTLVFALRDAPVCNRAGGIVLSDQLGVRLPSVTLRFVHQNSGRMEIVRTNLNGEFDLCLPLEGDYLVQVEREGYKPESRSVRIDASQRSYQEIRLRPTEVSAGVDSKVALGSPLREGSVILLDKINYEQGQASLNQSAIRYLDALYDLMQRYPTMEVDLVVHTDTRGNAEDNFELSRERGKYAKTYLVYKGISEKRINVIGKGGSEPRNRCRPGVQCTEEEHRENIRMEVKVRKIGA